MNPAHAELEGVKPAVVISHSPNQFLNTKTPGVSGRSNHQVEILAKSPLLEMSVLNMCLLHM